jgi:hypothetical protein
MRKNIIHSSYSSSIRMSLSEWTRIKSGLYIMKKENDLLMTHAISHWRILYWQWRWTRHLHHHLWNFLCTTCVRWHIIIIHPYKSVVYKHKLSVYDVMTRQTFIRMWDSDQKKLTTPVSEIWFVRRKARLLAYGSEDKWSYFMSVTYWTCYWHETVRDHRAHTWEYECYDDDDNNDGGGGGSGPLVTPPFRIHTFLDCWAV